MDLQEAYNTLDLAVKQFVKSAMLDDRTPLGNSLALAQEASLVGTGEGNPDVVVFGDMNRFKGLNDQLGHAAGDVAISTVGQLIYDLVQDCEGKGFRRGGDEFVVLLSKTRLDDFKARLAPFGGCTFKFEGRTHKTAMSFGYAVGEGEIDYADLLARAETACQSAKSQGDGTCVEWSPEIGRKELINFRDRCGNCGAQITVNVPKETAPADNRLMSCPCCGQSLSAKN
jgi:diguanylate cyclase (GGDEF)-like protein